MSGFVDGMCTMQNVPCTCVQNTSVIIVAHIMCLQLVGAHACRHVTCVVATLGDKSACCQSVEWLATDILACGVCGVGMHKLDGWLRMIV